MIKTIFKQGNSLDISALNCGYFSKPISKRITQLKEAAYQLQVSSLTAQQILDDFEYKIGIVYNRINDNGPFCDAKSPYAYDVIINPTMLSGEDPVNVVEQSINFPFLCTKKKRFSKIEASYLSPNKKIEIGKFKRQVAIKTQFLLDSFNGMHFLHPWYNENSLEIVPEFRHLFSRDFDINRYMDQYKENTFECDKEELMNTNFNSLFQQHSLLLRQYEPYVSLKEAMCQQYKSIKEFSYREFASNIDSLVPDITKERWYKIVQSMDI